MNTLDLFEYDATMGSQTREQNAPASGNPAEPPGSGPDATSSPTLNEEVTQVMGQLGRFWGGFRKQSASAFENARKDFGQVVLQAQKELGRLTEADQPADGAKSMPSEAPADDSTKPAEGEPAASTSSAEPPSSPITSSPSVSQRANQLFARLQSTLPPNLSETLQKRFHDAQESAAVSQVRTSISSGLARIQEQTKGMTLAQAEEFIQQRSEVILKDAGEFFREAVKVVPPEESVAATGGTIWDGSDSWMVSGSATPEPSELKSGKSKRNTRMMATKRADVLLHRLRTESDILLLDPVEGPNTNVKELYQKWSNDCGALDATSGVTSESWKDRREAALQAEDGALLKIRDLIVPSTLSEEGFWSRYFFRVYEIEQDEERRQALLKGATAQDTTDEDFAWEDEEEEAKSTTTASQAPVTHSAAPITRTDTKSTHLSTSPRESEDSYDVVSRASGAESRASPGTSVAGGPEAAAKSKDDDGDGDSDWE